MASYTNRDGETVDIERNDDGGYTVTGEEGEATTYEANSVEDIANDWDIDFGSIQNDPMFGGALSGDDDPGGNPVVDPSYDPRVDPSYDPDDDPGYDPGDDPREDPGEDPGDDPAEDPGYNS